MKAFENCPADVQFEQAMKKKKKESEAAVKSAGGSCLTCRFSQSALGIYILCIKKNKKVNMHSYCGEWKILKSLEEKSSENEKVEK